MPAPAQAPRQPEPVVRVNAPHCCWYCGIGLFWDAGQWWHPNPCMRACAVVMISYPWTHP